MQHCEHVVKNYKLRKLYFEAFMFFYNDNFDILLTIFILSSIFLAPSLINNYIYQMGFYLIVLPDMSIVIV